MRKFFLLGLIFILGAAANASVYRGWDIDSQMKFNVGYLPDAALSQSLIKPKAEKPSFKPYYSFDVNNINLAEFLALGFDVPKLTNPQEYNFYIKLYNLPDCLSNKLVFNKFTNDFSLGYSYDFDCLNSFISDRKNVAVKFSQIAPENSIYNSKNAIPKFLTSRGENFSNYFLNHIPFYSIYLIPTEKKLRTSAPVEAVAKWSTGGVKEFHADLISYYHRNFCECSGGDKKYYYFWAPDIKKEKIVVVKVPKQILVFDNWHDLPMPQNPKKVFLTSLLLVSSIDYKPNDGKIPAIIPDLNSEAFLKTFSQEKTTVLEVASVTRTR